MRNQSIMDFFPREIIPPPAACIFSAGRNFLKIQYKPRGHPCETGSPPPPPRRTSPFSRWRRGLVTMAILLLDRWLQPPPTTLSQHPPSPPDSFVLPATGTTNQSRTAKKYSITRQELDGGGVVVVVVVVVVAAAVLAMLDLRVWW